MVSYLPVVRYSNSVTMAYFLQRCNCDFQEYIILIVSAEKRVGWNAQGAVSTDKLVYWMPPHSWREKYYLPFYFVFLSLLFSASTWVCILRMMLLSHRTCAIGAYQ